MKLKYKAINDSSANFKKTNLSKRFKAKVILRYGKLKIKTKHPKETFIFNNPNDCDLSVMTEKQQNSVNLILNAVLKANGRFLNYKRKKQDKILRASPAGFLRYKETRELYIKNPSSFANDIFDQKMKVLNSYLIENETKNSTNFNSENILNKNNCEIVEISQNENSSNMEYACRVNKDSFTLKIKDVCWNTFVFNKNTEHSYFSELSSNEKDLIANWLNAILETLNSNTSGTFYLGSRKNFISSFPSDFLRYGEIRKQFKTFAGEDYDYIADEKIKSAEASLLWENEEKGLKAFDLQNNLYKK